MLMKNTSFQMEKVNLNLPLRAINSNLSVSDPIGQADTEPAGFMCVHHTPYPHYL